VYYYYNSCLAFAFLFFYSFCLFYFVLYTQGSYRSGKTGKSQLICVVREKSGKNIIFEKSGKMILDHADCRYLWFFASSNIKSRQICGFHWTSNS